MEDETELGTPIVAFCSTHDFFLSRYFHMSNAFSVNDSPDKLCCKRSHGVGLERLDCCAGIRGPDYHLLRYTWPGNINILIELLRFSEKVLQ